MFSDIFQRFIQKRPVATMVLILLEKFSSCKFSCDAILVYTNKEKPFNFNVENNYAYY